MIIKLQHSLFLDTFMSFSFRSLINMPTRITESTSTLIDNIFTNNFNDAHISGIFYTDVSDHFPVFSILSSKAPAKDKIKLSTFRIITPSGQVTLKMILLTLNGWMSCKLISLILHMTYLLLK